MGELMGAQPVTVQAAELSQALATGVVEAFMTSSQTGVDSRVYEQVKYFYDMQAALPKNAVFVSSAAFQALDKAQQAAVLKAASDAEERGWKASSDWNEKSKNTLVQKGVHVVQPSVKLSADAKQMGFSLLTDWQKRAGAEGEAVVANYQKAQVATPASKPARVASTPAAASGARK